MQERNFEKQVQEKMEELSFVPSEPVWKKVQEQIGKKKDRRRIIFWLLPLLLLTGGAYFWFNESGLPDTNQANVSVIAADSNRTTSSKKTDNNEPINEIPSATTNNSVTTINNSEEKSTFSLTEKKNKTIFETAPDRKKSTIKGGQIENQKNKVNIERSYVKKTTPQVTSKKEAVEKETEEDKSTTEKDIAKGDPQNAQSIDDKTMESNTDVVASDRLDKNENNTDTTMVKETPVEKKDSVIAKDSIAPQVNKPKPIVKKKWSWGAYASGGVSKLTSSSIKSSQAAMTANDLLSFNGANLQAAAPTPPARDKFFKLNPDFAFSVGANLQRNISQRFSVAAGVQYNYFSTWNYVGKSVSNRAQSGRLNSQVEASRFYLANSAEEEKYTNKYHYVGIPITIDWQVSAQLPLHIKGGFSLSRLVNTNALYFDKARQIYYKDKDYFNKNRFALATGLSYRLFRINKAALYAGPQAELGLSNVRKEASSGQRLLFAGLNAEVRF